MSKFSGKCDFYDEIEIFGIDKILSSNIYIGDFNHPIYLSSLEDCIPYYPYIVTMASYSNDNGRNIICLSSRSWLDIEEEKYGSYPFIEMCREYLREELKRHKNGG